MEWWSLREVGKSNERREMIGTRWNWQVKIGDRGEEVGGRRRGECGGLVLGDRRGEKVSLGEKNGEEFDQVKVALIPVFEPHVPN